MKKPLLLQIFLCAIFLGSTLYAYVKQQNDLTKIKIVLPKLMKEVQNICEENLGLRYQIECFENPKHLMEMAKRSEFSHLRYPVTDEIFVLFLRKGEPLNVKEGSSLLSRF